jgi:L,D-peptidoglycan transpeptidase YkuD (ErfK/YbiS/YcfS/YnhG family)
MTKAIKIKGYRLLIPIIFASVVSCTQPGNIEVTCNKNNEARATLSGKEYICAVGKNGLKQDKAEGDNATPIGSFPVREILFREDRIERHLLKTSLPLRSLTPYDGWCDDPKDPNYNKLVDLRTFDLAVSHEKLYRDDHLYDIIVIIGYNDNPPIPGKGSAIFGHVARENFSGTAGCIAFAKPDLLEIIEGLDKDSFIVVKGYSE